MGSTDGPSLAQVPHNLSDVALVWAAQVQDAETRATLLALATESKLRSSCARAFSYSFLSPEPCHAAAAAAAVAAPPRTAAEFRHEVLTRWVTSSSLSLAEREALLDFVTGGKKGTCEKKDALSGDFIFFILAPVTCPTCPSAPSTPAPVTCPPCSRQGKTRALFFFYAGYSHVYFQNRARNSLLPSSTTTKVSACVRVVSRSKTGFFFQNRPRSGSRSRSTCLPLSGGPSPRPLWCPSSGAFLNGSRRPSRCRLPQAWA